MIEIFAIIHPTPFFLSPAGAPRTSSVVAVKILHESGATAGGCHGVAIGFPGIVDVRKGRILSTLKKYKDAIHLDLEQWAIEQFGFG